MSGAGDNIYMMGTIDPRIYNVQGGQYILG